MSTKISLVIGIILIFLGIVGAGLYYLKDQFSPALKPGYVKKLSESSKVSTEPVDFELDLVAQDLNVPWSILFASNDRLIVSQRPGSIVSVEKGSTNTLITIPEVVQRSESGLMGLALDPDYDQNLFFYACYAYEDQGELFNRVIKLMDKDTTAQVVDTLIENIPSAIFHAGCRLGIGPDKKLYITTGDARTPSSAQKQNTLAGKILRLNLDGSNPSDNPFPNSQVYSLGHRNPQGITWHPENQKMFSTEHGPSGNDGPPGGDEVNLIQPGGNYGWPEVSHTGSNPNFISPLSVFTPAEAPASALIYSGKIFPQFKNSLLFGALRGEGIVVLKLNQGEEVKVEQIEKLDINLGRIREIVESPEGHIYFSTSNTDGRGNPNPDDDKIYRLIPKN